MNANQKKVRQLIAQELPQKNDADLKEYLKNLDVDLHQRQSPYYLDKAVQSKIVHNGTTSPEDLKRLFEDGTPLPSTTIQYTPKKYKNVTGKPFDNVLCTTLDKLIEKTDFNGEVYLKGEFWYTCIMLPQQRTSNIPNFYEILTAILNGYAYCTDADKQALRALAYEIYRDYAPSHTIMVGTTDHELSFIKIDRIINKVLSDVRFPDGGQKRKIDIIWNPDYVLTGKEKSAYYMSNEGKNTRQKEYDRMLNLYDPNLTNKQNADKAGVSLSKFNKFKRSLRNKQLEDPKTGFLKIA